MDETGCPSARGLMRALELHLIIGQTACEFQLVWPASIPVHGARAKQNGECPHSRCIRAQPGNSNAFGCALHGCSSDCLKDVSVHIGIP
eukprot:6207747-Pleurochrysis_carterae.AAC.3